MSGVLDYDRLSYDPGASAQLLRPEVAAMRWPAADDDSLALALESRGVARPGAVLLQSPYEQDTYAPEGEAAEIFSLEKFATFSMLCQLLGAREVRVLTVQEQQQGEKFTVDANLGVGPVAASSKVKSSGLDRLAASLSWDDTYTGGSADIEVAKQLLLDRQLDTDPILRSLVEQSAYDANRHTTRSLVVDLTRESEKTLDVAANLRIPAYLDASATFQRNRSAKIQYRVEYRVVF